MANKYKFTLDEVLQGKATRIKNRQYFKTADYVEPFLDRMSKYTSEFNIQVKEPDQVTLDQSGNVITKDITFNRVNIEAILPDEYAFDGHKKVIGMVYGLDVRKPVVKHYVGAIRSACLNLCVFSPMALHCQELEPEKAIDYSFVNQCLDFSDSIGKTLKSLSEKQFNKDECLKMLGYWIERCIVTKHNSNFGVVKIAESIPIEAFKSLYIEDESDYFNNNGIVTGFDIYNAFTDIICNGKTADIMNRFEKVYLVSKILNLKIN